MTQDQLKELETLNERWANECPTQRKMLDCALDIMDLLPDAIQALKEREGLMANLDYSVNLAVATATEKLTAERDAALKACAEMRDALSHLKAADMEWCDAMALADHAMSTDCGKGYVPKAELDAANAKCAEMMRQIDCAVMALEFWYKMPHPSPTQVDIAIEALRRGLSTSYSKGYHHDDEWKPVVEALKNAGWYPCTCPKHFPGHGVNCEIGKALAHAERLTGGQQ